ncbi:hypothetical protein WICPIJ_009236 [Wickerhamomyces pijperi]|uniref:Sm domain-containing protein n=1 Tax=Wickerhamomyces pijperi TaxID=599730 RepID=A0A9P8TDR8_WICPI|nr:hypothetical protein WICPIJ_009236 [Wickerhamomyces pijperi]
MQGIESLIPSDLIGAQLTIKLNTKPENREVKGILLALDNKPNLLLQNVLEITKDDDGNVVRQRDIGMVSVPFTTIDTVSASDVELETMVRYRSQVI